VLLPSSSYLLLRTAPLRAIHDPPASRGVLSHTLFIIVITFFTFLIITSHHLNIVVTFFLFILIH
jgi:hypothetical protein